MCMLWTFALRFSLGHEPHKHNGQCRDIQNGQCFVVRNTPTLTAEDWKTRWGALVVSLSLLGVAAARNNSFSVDSTVVPTTIIKLLLQP